MGGVEVGCYLQTGHNKNCVFICFEPCQPFERVTGWGGEEEMHHKYTWALCSFPKNKVAG